MAEERKHFMDEPDIGSGARNPAQQDIDREIQRVNVPLPQVGEPQTGQHLSNQVIEEQDYANQAPTRAEQEPIMAHDDASSAGRTIQSGDHIARIAVARQEDGTFEAQVFLRLEREPQTAETYIPVGLYPSVDDAMRAAEERARRAIDEKEF